MEMCPWSNLNEGLSKKISSRARLAYLPHHSTRLTNFVSKYWLIKVFKYLKDQFRCSSHRILNYHSATAHDLKMVERHCVVHRRNI